MLRLVQSPPGGNGADPPARRKGLRSAALSLTADEARHVRAAVKNVARAYGGRDVLALVMEVPADTLSAVVGASDYRPSGTFAIRLARAAGVSVESILSGKLAAAGACPTCGHRVGAGRTADAGGGR